MSITKLYVGKIFSLKSHYSIPWTSHNTLPERYYRYERDPKTGKEVPRKGRDGVQYASHSMPRKEIGERVLIINESTKKVRVITKKGKAIWISKYYLKQEIIEEIENNPQGEISKILNKLTEIGNSREVSKFSEDIFGIIRKLRLLQGRFEPEK